MRKLMRFDLKYPLILTLAMAALVTLPGCSVNVKKDSEGKEKNVDIETPLGALHVDKDADIRDVGLSVYPGARRKEKSDDEMRTTLTSIFPAAFSASKS